MNRIRQLQKHFFLSRSRKSPEGFLISKAKNIGYLTGFWGTFGRLLVTRKKAILFSDARYSEKARSVLPDDVEYTEIERAEDFWKMIFQKSKIETLGFEADEVTVVGLKNLKKAFGSRITLLPLSETVEKLREEKDVEEIDCIRKAAGITDRALEKILPLLRTGVTEREIAWLLEKAAREDLGAEGMSFPPIVAFEANSALPHHESSEKKLRENVPVLIDFGVKYRHYCSDMTRSFFFGKPTKDWIKAYEMILEAQKQAIGHLVAGKKIAVSDQVARKSLGGDAQYFVHSLGHGVGLEIHEAPHLSERSRGVFSEHMVVTAEPGLYFPGKFGIRIEDLLLVGKKESEELSRFPKNIEAMVLHP